MPHYLIAFALFLFSCGSVFSQNQNSEYLLEKQVLQGLLDSTSFQRLVYEEDGVKKWKPVFSFIDQLDVSKITYLSDDLKVKGYLVQPKQKGNYPCIIWNRGGVKNYGAITTLRATAMMGMLAKEGYVVIATQYRGNGGSEGQEEFGGADLNDVLNLKQVLADIPHADTSRIGMFGGSRGGMMTYLALAQSDWIKAAAVLAAPVDRRASHKFRPHLEDSMYELVPGYEENKQAELDKRSPILWVDSFPKTTPILIMHGNADWRVRTSHSLEMALELDVRRIPYRLIIFEGDDHGLSLHREDFYQELITWFNTYVKNDTPLQAWYITADKAYKTSSFILAIKTP
ncbi:S9 family peptidase [bacterium SCSIO 12741]|nr:S9 family peptidase [bacterium SCSIO 12741]